MEKFSVTVKEGNLKKETIFAKAFMEAKPLWERFKDFIGCNPIYQAAVISEPKQAEGGYKYDIKVISKTIRIFGIKIKTIKL